MSNNNSAAGITYWDYISTDTLLSLQSPVTNAHDELQFIIVHQAFELWFKLAITELRSAISSLLNDNTPNATRLLNRVVSILRTAEKGFDPLMTMSQQGYLEFRDALAPASGFQSVQFRIIEILIGIRRMDPTEEIPRKHFYWEKAVQAGRTFDAFVEKYYAMLNELAEEFAENNLRDLMLRLTEHATGQQGSTAYKTLLANRDEHLELAQLADAANDLQLVLLDFRRGHHRVTRFTIGDHAVGTSDAHAPTQQSCSSYLSNVIKERSVIFPELENAVLE